MISSTVPLTTRKKFAYVVLLDPMFTGMRMFWAGGLTAGGELPDCGSSGIFISSAMGWSPSRERDCRLPFHHCRSDRSFADRSQLQVFLAKRFLQAQRPFPIAGIGFLFDIESNGFG